MKTMKRRMLAEWEHQSMVQLTWPHKDTDWAPILDEITAVYEEMAREISKHEPLLIVDDIPHNDTWARDHGFITVEEQDDSLTSHHSPLTSKLLLDFCFNGWGEKFEAKLDNEINRHLYDQGLVKGEYESLKEWLGAERIVWLQHGSLLGDDTDGHIDTLARICPNDTLLYTGGDEEHPDLAEMERELQELRTLDGKAYRLLKLPLPRPIFDDGDRLPATYANYLVVNGAVLVPTYNQPDLDEEAMRIIGQAFPDREIVGIDCRAVIKQHGSLHCCTMQYY